MEPPANDSFTAALNASPLSFSSDDLCTGGRREVDSFGSADAGKLMGSLPKSEPASRSAMD